MLEGFERDELLQLSWGKPMMAQLELTRECNQRCIFCFRACCPEIKYPVLSGDQWKTIIGKLKRLGVRRLNFSGGENFLHPNFVSTIIFAKTEGFEVIVNTNGTFDCGPIAKYSDEIIFSVHGFKKIHESITGRQGSFEAAESHLMQVANLLTRVSVNMVLVKSNYEQMNSLFEYFDKLYNLHKFSPTVSIRSLFGFKHADQALEITEEFLEDYKRRIAAIPAQKLELKHGFQTIYFGDPALYTKPVFPLANCAGGKYKLVIDCNGDVYPCNFFRDQEFYCGNILTDDEMKIWRTGKGFERFRKLALQETIPQKCHTCLKKARCMSGCRAWSSQYQNGGFENVSDLRCQIGNAFIGSGNYH